MKLFAAKKIQIAKSSIHGFGVFATSNIEKGELIEECLFLELPIKSNESSPLLIDYRYNYPQGVANQNTIQVIVLGLASIYNHSENPNAYWTTDTNRKTFKFWAKHKIFKGQEICTYYGGQSYWEDGRSNINVK